MNAPTSFSMQNKDVLLVELDVLKTKHRELDTQIETLHHEARVSSFYLQQLKREKLRLKDKIAHIQDRLIPDIIA